jgi:hypothetical protein
VAQSGLLTSMLLQRAAPRGDGGGEKVASRSAEGMRAQATKRKSRRPEVGEIQRFGGLLAEARRCLEVCGWRRWENGSDGAGGLMG